MFMNSNNARLHQVALRVLPDASGAGFPPAAWASTIAAIGAWPATEPVRPVLERRFWRDSRRGGLREAVIGGMQDPLDLWTPADAEGELRELLRPLWSSRPLPKVSAEGRRQLSDPVAPYVAELGRLDGTLPEGNHALAPIFAQLVAGIAALEGPVGLSLLVTQLDTPASSVERVDRAEDAPERRAAEQIRQLGFSLRLFGRHPLPPVLRARAEALCLATSARNGEWTLAMGGRAAPGAEAVRWQRPLGSAPRPARADIVALTLALPAPAGREARVVLGRPVAGALPKSGAVLGRVPRVDGRQVAWRLPWEERRLHTLIAGSSGCGKTTAMLRLMLDDIDAGRTVVMVDPHGDVADQLSAVVPSQRLVHIDPRRERTAKLDLLDPDPARAASHLLSAASEVWPADYAGPVWHRAISLACRGLDASSAIQRRATLLDVERFFTDARWRATIVGGVGDRQLSAELKREHEAWQQPSRDDASMTNWLASKLTPLTGGPGRPLFDAPAPTTLEEDITRGAVTVLALPIGTLGHATTALTARMFLSRLTAAVAHQGDRPEQDRQPVSVFIDEAHIAVGDSLAGLFAQARKFNCSVTVACQSPSQLEPHLEQVLTNAQTHLYGRLSQREAALVGARIGDAGVRALPRLPRHHLLVATEDNDPTLPPIVLTPVAPPGLDERVVVRVEPEAVARVVETEPEEAAEPRPFEDVLAGVLALDGR